MVVSESGNQSVLRDTETEMPRIPSLTSEQADSVHLRLEMSGEEMSNRCHPEEDGPFSAEISRSSKGTVGEAGNSAELIGGELQEDQLRHVEVTDSGHAAGSRDKGGGARGEHPKLVTNASDHTEKHEGETQHGKEDLGEGASDALQKSQGEEDDLEVPHTHTLVALREESKPQRKEEAERDESESREVPSTGLELAIHTASPEGEEDKGGDDHGEGGLAVSVREDGARVADALPVLSATLLELHKAFPNFPLPESHLRALHLQERFDRQERQISGPANEAGLPTFFAPLWTGASASGFARLDPAWQPTVPPTQHPPSSAAVASAPPFEETDGMAIP
eukprot:TRINITY_DN8746_c0_g2_i1.p1 TRINITY_DN8746_c0_g2~~TRINITY_DN8746_c0_g2_i1.p1  ORF type:complete len:351 (+),score=68.41 TRINITY_DN8746_c0_g2_i1:44-1054(+)